MPSRDSASAVAKPSPPDCMTSPATPGLGCAAANVASRPIPGTATPKQFGPISRMPCRRQAASKPARVASSSPEVITTHARTPRWPHCSAVSTRAAAGTAITARSTCPGRSAGEARAGSPPI